MLGFTAAPGLLLSSSPEGRASPHLFAADWNVHQARAGAAAEPMTARSARQKLGPGYRAKLSIVPPSHRAQAVGEVEEGRVRRALPHAAGKRTWSELGPRSCKLEPA